jgi:hypothetical protein
MRKIVVLMMACALLVGVGLGQGAGQHTSFGQSRVQFRSTEWVGLSSGEVGSAGQVQTVNGVAKGPWFAGVGAGLDYYRFRSVPLFLSVTRDLAIGKRDWLFLYVDGGTNVPWYSRNLSSNGYDGIVSSKFNGGEYWSGGLGYLWKLGAHTSKAVLLSVGYTVKKLSENQVVASSCAPANCDLVHYEYLNRMYQFMIGFRF